MKPERVVAIALLLGAGCRDSGPAEGVPTGAWSLSTGTPSGQQTVTIPEHAHRNLLVISIDTLRRDHVPRYDDQGRNLMPFLDSLMDQSVVANAHHPGANWTFHSFSTSLAGRYPLESDVLPKLDVETYRPWPADTRMLVDELEDSGFTTILASANGWLKPQFGLGAHYDRYLGEAFDAADQTWALGSSALQDELDAGNAGRWYLHLHFLEPHAPFTPPDEYRVGEDQLAPSPWNLDTQPAHYAVVGDYAGLTPDEKDLLEAHLQVRYDGELRWLDERLASFWAELEGKGWLDDTLVVFWSDHGEQFWERGNQSHGFHLYPEESQGLFFVWSKSIAAQDLSLRTSGIDIAPTILDGLGVPIPADWTGVPIDSIEAGRPVFADADARLGVVHSVTRNNRSLIYRWNGEVGFYHLDTDPKMLDNRFDAGNPEVQELWELLRPRIQKAIGIATDQTAIAPLGLAI